MHERVIEGVREGEFNCWREVKRTQLIVVAVPE